MKSLSAVRTTKISVHPHLTLGHGVTSSSTVDTVCLTADLLHHLAPTVPLPQDLTGLLHTTTSKLPITSTTVRRMARRATTTTARVLLAQALTAKDNTLAGVDATVAAAVAKVVTAPEDEGALVSTTADLATTALADIVVLAGGTTALLAIIMKVLPAGTMALLVITTKVLTADRMVTTVLTDITAAPDDEVPGDAAAAVAPLAPSVSEQTGNPAALVEMGLTRPPS